MSMSEGAAGRVFCGEWVHGGIETAQIRFIVSVTISCPRLVSFTVTLPSIMAFVYLLLFLLSFFFLKNQVSPLLFLHLSLAGLHPSLFPLLFLISYQSVLWICHPHSSLIIIYIRDSRDRMHFSLTTAGKRKKKRLLFDNYMRSLGQNEWPMLPFLKTLYIK